jgi:hypothetical protein
LVERLGRLPEQVRAGKVLYCLRLGSEEAKSDVRGWHEVPVRRGISTVLQNMPDCSTKYAVCCRETA